MNHLRHIYGVRLRYIYGAAFAELVTLVVAIYLGLTGTMLDHLRHIWGATMFASVITFIVALDQLRQKAPQWVITMVVGESLCGVVTLVTSVAIPVIAYIIVYGWAIMSVVKVVIWLRYRKGLR